MNRRFPRLLSVLVAAGTAIVLAACGRPSGDATWLTAATASPSVSSSPSASPSPSGRPCPATLAGSVPAEISSHVARLPCFDAVPTPAKVALPHGNGYAAWAYEIPTDRPVAFLTIDDGATQVPYAAELIQASGVPVTLFLTTNYVGGNPAYFSRIRDTGRVSIENHTISHPSLPGLGYGGARSQLCGASDSLGTWFGTRPIYFRPPFGDVSNSTLQAAWDCGLQVGFHWRETADNGKVWYQRPDHVIHQGDIILMHFRPAFYDDFLAAVTAIHDAGLTPALLSDYVELAPASGGAPFADPPPQASTGGGEGSTSGGSSSGGSSSGGSSSGGSSSGGPSGGPSGDPGGSDGSSGSPGSSGDPGGTDPAGGADGTDGTTDSGATL